VYFILFCFVILEIDFDFMTGQTWTLITVFELLCSVGVTGMHHWAQPLVDMGIS
jgi:hypothetical protein